MVRLVPRTGCTPLGLPLELRQQRYDRPAWTLDDYASPRSPLAGARLDSLRHRGSPRTARWLPERYAILASGLTQRSSACQFITAAADYHCLRLVSHYLRGSLTTWFSSGPLHAVPSNNH